MKNSNYYTIIDREYMDRIINSNEPLMFSCCEGPVRGVDLSWGPEDMREIKDTAADPNPDATTPAAETQSQNTSFGRLINKMSFSSEEPAMEMSQIKKQLAQHWIIPAGLQEIKDPYVDVKVDMNPGNSPLSHGCEYQ